MLGRGGTEGSLKGIGPGRFKVDVAFGGAFGSSKTFEVTSTGSGEIPLTVDLR
jgi:hypothetical protein